MDLRRAVGGLLVLAVAGLLVVTLVPGLLIGDPGPYERVTLTVTDADGNGTELATVEARVADTRTKKRIGLSETDALAPDEGMLFVFDGVGTRALVMSGPREEMSFPLDMVFLDADGTVTGIRHAAVDATGRFTGTGKYVLEVKRGWANRTGVSVGDRVLVPESVG